MTQSATTPMIQSLKLRHFRGIESVDFDGLSQVNLIVGGNNSGKTSVLEALSLMYADTSQIQNLPKQFRQSANENDIWTNFWPTLFFDQDSSKFNIQSNDCRVSVLPKNNNKIEFEKYFSEENNNSVTPSGRILSIDSASSGSFYNNPQLKGRQLSILSTHQPPPQETSRLFNEIAPLNPENEAKLESLIRQSIEPRLRRLRYAKLKNTREHLVYVDLGSGPMIPFTQMGQAFARALHIYCEIFSQQPDILLIDEIENGLYYRGLEDFWKGLFEVLIDQKVQLFATTHSRECMEAAQLADEKHREPHLRFLRLDRNIDDPQEIIGTSFGRETMHDAMQFHQEMR